MDKITTKATFLHATLASNLILREMTLTRLVFQSMLVDNLNTSASLQALKNAVMVRSASKLIPADATTPRKLSKPLCHLIAFI